jgi:hypothetical protein
MVGGRGIRTGKEGGGREHAMRTMISASLMTAVAFAPVSLVSPALAEERTCRGTIVGTTVDNLRVPEGARCTLNRTRVEGTVKVEREREVNLPVSHWL